MPGTIKRRAKTLTFRNSTRPFGAWQGWSFSTSPPRERHMTRIKKFSPLFLSPPRVFRLLEVVTFLLFSGGCQKSSDVTRRRKKTALGCLTLFRRFWHSMQNLFYLHSFCIADNEHVTKREIWPPNRFQLRLRSRDEATSILNWFLAMLPKVLLHHRGPTVDHTLRQQSWYVEDCFLRSTSTEQLLCGDIFWAPGNLISQMERKRKTWGLFSLWEEGLSPP